METSNIQKPDLYKETEEEKLRHDLHTAGYVLKVLRGIGTLTGKREQDDDFRLAGDLQDIMTHFVESGGSGYEALARLIGIGVIDEIPNYKVIGTGREAHDSMPKYALEVKKVRKPETEELDHTELTFDLEFLAKTPEAGREMWNLDFGEIKSFDDLCSTRIALIVPVHGYKEAEMTFAKQYSDIMDKLYPDRKEKK